MAVPTRTLIGTAVFTLVGGIMAAAMLNQTDAAIATAGGRAGGTGDREIVELEYPSLDRRAIPAVLSMPAGDGPFPVVVTIHGGEGNRTYPFLRTLAAPGLVSPTVDLLNEQPWAILAISFRAGGGAIFGAEEDDIVAGIRFAKTLPRIDPERVGVLGGSHGGYLALRAAQIMGTEFRCVAAGSPWMTNPHVNLFGTADQPPLSLLPAATREPIMSQGRDILRALRQNRGLSDEAIDRLLAEHSIEGNVEAIVIPSLIITSEGDRQVPHVLVAPTIARLMAAGRDVSVYTATVSRHGFYWGRDGTAARAGLGEKTPEELAEEARTRDEILRFFTSCFV